MDKNAKSKDGGVTPVFDTLAVLDKARQTPKSGVTIPSGEAVKRAKDWVDENRL